MRTMHGFLLALLVIPAGASAQRMRSPSGDAMVRGNAAARAVVHRAIEAMGGLERLSAIGATRRSFSQETRDAWQGARPIPGDETGPVIERSEGSWVYDPATRRAMTEETGKIFGGQRYARRRYLSPQGGFLAQDSLRRLDSLPPTSTAAALTTLERQLPETLLAQVWAGRHRVQSLDKIEGAQRITWSADDGALLVLAFASETGLPISVEQLFDHAALGDYVYRITYGDWRDRGGVRLPWSQMEEWATGSRTRMITELVLRLPADAAAVSPPRGYAGPPPQPGASQPLGKGVHHIPGAYNTLLVEFADFVVAVEPALGTRAATRVLAEAERLAPGKPVRYVVATHFHDDHLAGVRPYLAGGATVITTAHAARAVEEIAGVRKQMYPDTLDRAPRSTKVEVVADRRVIADSTQRLEILSIGRSPHADQMLVVWIPGPGVLYEADLLDLDVPVGATPMPGDDTRHFARWLTDNHLPVHTIVPTHGRLGTLDDLRRAAAR